MVTVAPTASTVGGASRSHSLSPSHVPRMSSAVHADASPSIVKWVASPVLSQQHTLPADAATGAGSRLAASGAIATAASIGRAVAALPDPVAGAEPAAGALSLFPHAISASNTTMTIRIDLAPEEGIEGLVFNNNCEHFEHFSRLRCNAMPGNNEQSE